MILRNANSDDLDRIIQLGFEFCAESPTYKKHGFNPEFAYETLQTLIAKDCVAVVEDFGFVVGFMIAIVQQQWHSGVLVASDLALYVTPEYRRSTAATQLVEWFDKWAIEQRAVAAMCGNTTGNSNRAIALYEMYGFKSVGTVVAKEYE